MSALVRSILIEAYFYTSIYIYILWQQSYILYFQNIIINSKITKIAGLENNKVLPQNQWVMENKGVDPKNKKEAPVIRYKYGR